MNIQTFGPAAPVLRAIAAERERQVQQEGWSPKHDDQHIDGELAAAAAAYCVVDLLQPGAGYDAEVLARQIWPFGREWWKPANPAEEGAYRRNLIKAGALIVAELERLARLAGDPTVSGRESPPREPTVELAGDDVAARVAALRQAGINAAPALRSGTAGAPLHQRRADLDPADSGVADAAAAAASAKRPALVPARPVRATVIPAGGRRWRDLTMEQDRAEGCAEVQLDDASPASASAMRYRMAGCPLWIGGPPLWRRYPEASRLPPATSPNRRRLIFADIALHSPPVARLLRAVDGAFGVPAAIDFASPAGDQAVYFRRVGNRIELLDAAGVPLELSQISAGDRARMRQRSLASRRDGGAGD